MNFLTVSNFLLLSLPKEIVETVTSNFTSFGSDIQTLRQTCTCFRTIKDSQLLWQIARKIHVASHHILVHIPAHFKIDKREENILSFYRSKYLSIQSRLFSRLYK